MGEGLFSLTLSILLGCVGLISSVNQFACNGPQAIKNCQSKPSKEKET